MTVTETRVSRSLRTLQVAAWVGLALIGSQFVSAGGLLMNARWALPVHSIGALALHVPEAVAVVAAWSYQRSVQGPTWPTVVTAIVFACGLLQAWLGYQGVLLAHVPGAFVLTAGTVLVLIWSTGPQARHAV